MGIITMGVRMMVEILGEGLISRVKSTGNKKRSIPELRGTMNLNGGNRKRSR